MGRGGGGLQNGRGGGQVKFYPYKKGDGGGKRFSHAGRGVQEVLGSFEVRALSFSHAEVGGGGGKKFPPFKKRGR